MGQELENTWWAVPINTIHNSVCVLKKSFQKWQAQNILYQKGTVQEVYFDVIAHQASDPLFKKGCYQIELQQQCQVSNTQHQLSDGPFSNFQHQHGSFCLFCAILSAAAAVAISLYF